MTPPTPLCNHAPSAQLLRRMREEYTFQISVDTNNIPQGVVVADAATACGVTIVEMGTPLVKCEGAKNVVPAFRERYPDALLLADMKTMDGGALEARTVFGGGGNIIDFLALSGRDTARAICAVRDEFRESDPDTPRLVFADILLPHLASRAVEVTSEMLDAGVDGIGVHLQLDARRANPDLSQSNYFTDFARAVSATVGGRAPVQVVGGLSVEQAVALARDGMKAFVISGNLGVGDATMRLNLPGAEIQAHISRFMTAVRAVPG